MEGWCPGLQSRVIRPELVSDMRSIMCNNDDLKILGAMLDRETLASLNAPADDLMHRYGIVPALEQFVFP